MSATPPICHIPPVTPKTQPGPVNMPSIPPAGPTIPQLLATVNAMRQVIIILSGQLAAGPQGPRGAQGAAGTSGAKGTWNEQSRTTETVKVFQNNDPSTGNFVEVEQVNSLNMVNKDTGQTWKWTR